MTISAADLDNLETNIKAADDWVGGNSATIAIAANGRTIKSVAKINEEANTAFDQHLATLGYEQPIPFASSILVNRNTIVVEESGNNFAPLVSKIPFTTTGVFDSAQWYLITDFLPSQTGNAGKRLTTDGVTSSWTDDNILRVDTTELIISGSNFPLGSTLRTPGYSSSTGFGGADWVHNSVTGQTVSQSPAQLADALLNDASGNQWAIVGDTVSPTQLGDSLSASLLSGLIVDMTGAGSLALTSQISISSDLNIICRDDSVITGFDGLGILFSGGNITLNGVNISGFYDGTDQNASNFGTAFLRIATGTAVNNIKVIGGSAFNCRSVIRGTGIVSDTEVDTTITVNSITINKNKINGCPLAYYFRCDYTDAKVTENTCLNAIGASTGLTPYSFYVDGVGFDAAIYKTIGGAIFSNNYANTIINRVTTGDSTGGNTFECHVFKASGEKITIENNIIIDCTGINFDCEAFYTKARYTTMNNNVLIDAGTNEGVLNIKGTSTTSSGTDTSPFGEYSQISNNIIRFTRDVFTNDVTVVNLTTVGIHLAVGDKTMVTGNLISGANTNDIIFQGVIGPASANSDIICSGNISSDAAGEASIKFRGAFKRVKCFDNICDDVRSDGKSFYMFDLVSVANRGDSNDLNEFCNNQLKLGYETANESTFTHSFIRVDLENYDFNILRINSNLIDIISTSASARPIYITSQSGGFTGDLNKLIVKYNDFANGDYVKGPVFIDKRPLSFDLDLDYDFGSSQNSAVDAIAINTADDTETDAELRVLSTRTDTTTNLAQRDVSNFLGSTASGTLTSIVTVNETPVGNAVGIGITLATTSDFLRVRISGEDSQTWNHKIKLKVSNR